VYALRYTCPMNAQANGFTSRMASSSASGPGLENQIIPS